MCDFDTRLPYYMACSSAACKFKKLQNNEGSYVCGSCQSEDVVGVPRFMVGFNITDHTHTANVTAFHQASEVRITFFRFLCMYFETYLMGFVHINRYKKIFTTNRKFSNVQQNNYSN